MTDFSYLEPTEKLFIVRHRFRMLSDVLIEVLQLNEQKKAFRASPLCKSACGNEAVRLLLETITKYEIAQTCRLWDDVDPSGFSIPTIINLLESADVRQLLHSKETPDSQVVDFSSAKVSQDFLYFLDTVFNPAVDTAIKVIKSKELERLKSYRNKNIAHPIYRTRKENKKGIIDEIEETDVEYAVAHAMSIVYVLQPPLSLPFVDYPSLRNNFSKTIQPFYESLRHT
jgi:hypothetical protein